MIFIQSVPQQKGFPNSEKRFLLFLNFMVPIFLNEYFWFKLIFNTWSIESMVGDPIYIALGKRNA